MSMTKPITAVLFLLVIAAQVHATTMEELIRGSDLRLEYADGSVLLVTFTPNGKYKTNTGSRGTWTLEGETLCTVRNTDGAAGCGILPSTKSRGDVWTSTDAEGFEVTASIVKRGQ